MNKRRLQIHLRSEDPFCSAIILEQKLSIRGEYFMVDDGDICTMNPYTHFKHLRSL